MNEIRAALQKLDPTGDGIRIEDETSGHVCLPDRLISLTRAPDGCWLAQRCLRRPFGVTPDTIWRHDALAEGRDPEEALRGLGELT